MTSLFRTSPESESRTLTRIGAIVALLVAIAAALFSVVKPFARKPADLISVIIDAPYVGEGVANGTPLIIHGVKVGQVAGISSLAGGGVRLSAELESGPTTGLTDAMGIDFRPSNYFGVTGINLIPNAGGRPLQNDTQIKLIPVGNFSLQALLYRFGEISGVFDRRLINVIERATRYTDALTPLVETLFTVTKSVTKVQTVSTAQLLRNTTGISVALPGLTDGVMNLLHDWRMTYAAEGYDPEAEIKLNPFVNLYDPAMKKIYDDNRNVLRSNPDEYVHGRLKGVLRGADTDVFSAVGKLESSHIYELFPAIELLRVMADVVPKLIDPVDIADKLHELRARLTRMYEGPGDQRALQVRIILDELPGVAAPLGLALGAAG
jgi:hypothetical protein